MSAIIRPSRKASFAKSVAPDMLDAQIQNLIDAIHSTQEALADIRRDDGQLKAQPQTQPKVSTRITEIEQRIIDTAAAVASAASQFAQSSRDIELRAKDAEAAAFSVSHTYSQLTEAGEEAGEALGEAENAAEEAKAAAIAAQNSANYSQAQTDNAIKANTEATQWAEYLAGPVVNPAEAPAYISGHPFGHGLYYQPVEGGLAGLWSAKWWALYAQQLVGSWSFYYLGSWATPPIPGSTNPETGQSVPNPLSPGSFYYNTESHQLFVWDGSQWNEPYAPVLTPGYASSYDYVATAGQTNFSGPDIHGKTPDVGVSPSDVHVNGLRLVYGSQYSVNASTNTMTLVTPATVGAKVQWDLLTQTATNVGVSIRKVIIAPVPDGINRTFTMTYVDPDSGGTLPTDVVGGAQLSLSLDGVTQEPGIDYVASADALTMSTAPQVNSRFWGLWFAAGVAESAPLPSLPVNVTPPAILGSTTQGQTLTATPGTWTGYPTPLLSFQWKSGTTDVGANQATYVTQVSDVTKIMTVQVTATNSQGTASSTSGNFGPIVALVVDTTPDAFSFTDQTGVAVSTVIVSNTITVTGINAAAAVSVTTGEYSINGGAYTTLAGTVVVNDTVRVRGTSSAFNSTAVNVALTIGGVSDTFTITTVAGTAAHPTYFTYFF